MIRLQTLGSLDLRTANGTPCHQILRQPKRLALLAYLAIEKPGQFHRRDHLLGLFWPEADLKGGRGNLSQAVHFLRQALGKDAIINRGDEEIGINVHLVSCDAAAFQSLSSAGEYAAAMALYSGELLPGFFVDDADGFEQWLEQKRTDLQREAMRVASALADAAAQQAAYADVVMWLRRAISFFPYDESLHQRLIIALDQGGDRAAALRAYDELEHILGSEFEATPSAETRKVIEAVRARSEAQFIPRAPARVAVTPGSPTTLPVSTEFEALQPKRSRLVATVAVALLGVSALIWGALAFRAPQPAGAPMNRIAVLFFNDVSPESDLGYLADGLTSSLIDHLGQVRQIEVISQNGVRPFRGDSIPLDSIARQLAVGTIVGGSLTKSGDRLRVTVEMVKGATGILARSRTFERPSGELFALLDDVASEVGSFLRASLGEEVKLQQYRAETNSVAAWQAVQKAEQILSQAAAAGDQGRPAAANALFAQVDSVLTRAATIDDDWASPLIVQARAHETRAWLALMGGTPQTHLDQALHAATAALKRDPRSAAAYETRGRVRFVGWLMRPTKDARGAQLLAEAESDLTQALALDPERGRAESTLSLLYESQGRFADARSAAQRALSADAYLEDADQIISRLFESSFNVGDDEEAGRWCDEVRRRLTGRWPAAYCDLLLLGWRTDQKADARKALYIVETFGTNDREELRTVMRPRLLMLAAATVARAGDVRRAERMLAEARSAAPHDHELLQLEAAARLVFGDTMRAAALIDRYLLINPAARPRIQNGRMFAPLGANDHSVDVVAASVRLVGTGVIGSRH